MYRHAIWATTNLCCSSIPIVIHRALWLSRVAQIELIELYDRTGRKIRNITTDFDRINISDLEKGLYLLQVCDTEKKSDVLKFLKL